VMTKRILAIDDSRTIRSLLTQTLQKAGFEVSTAVDGVDGIEKFQHEDADLVITDVNMPNKDVSASSLISAGAPATARCRFWC